MFLGVTHIKANAKELKEEVNQMEQPNKETTAAMLEAECIARDPSAKRFTDVEAALRALKE